MQNMLFHLSVQIIIIIIIKYFGAYVVRSYGIFNVKVVLAEFYSAKIHLYVCVCYFLAPNRVPKEMMEKQEMLEYLGLR